LSDKTTPGFTADASLYDNTEVYRLVVKHAFHIGDRAIIPQMRGPTCTGCNCDPAGNCICDKCTWPWYYFDRVLTDPLYYMGPVGFEPFGKVGPVIFV
jgi:hypothetical protein